MKHKSAMIAAKILVAARTFIYKHGFRPKRGSLLYSPSLEAMHLLKGILKAKKRK